VYSLRALIRPGNSGGPLVSTSGNVLGMIFAASVTDKETGYALTSDQLKQAAAQGTSATAQVNTGPCA
jgi:S1-C subfamily serine protease